MLQRSGPKAVHDYDSGMDATAPSTLHLLGHFTELFTGAERELLEIRHLVGARRPVKIWSDVPVSAAYAGDAISSIQPFARQYPASGVLLIAGVHMQAGVWLKYTKFGRIILFYNLANHGQLFAVIEDIRHATGLEPELVFVSHMLQKSVGLPGQVIRSLMDIVPFTRLGEQRLAWNASGKSSGSGGQRKALAVGRISRDAPDKHHPEDPALYRMLASRGVRVRIMGGMCLAPLLSGVEGIELLPAGAMPAADFYRSLDIFFYRTGASVEAYGRVVLEAMASGLPVVAHSRGGYAEVVEDGISGFLVHTQEQAWDTLMRLCASVELRTDVGRAAMVQAFSLHGRDAMERDLAFYL